MPLSYVPKQTRVPSDWVVHGMPAPLTVSPARTDVTAAEAVAGAISAAASATSDQNTPAPSHPDGTIRMGVVAPRRLRVGLSVPVVVRAGGARHRADRIRSAAAGYPISSRRPNTRWNASPSP